MPGVRADSFTSWTPLDASRPTPVANALPGAGISKATDFPLPATCWRARKYLTTPPRLTSREKSAVPATADRGDAVRRGRRRRQARQAVGCARDLRRG